jgi:Histidine kinase-, DNA gyrase B-, and HSP90-like ATPase
MKLESTESRIQTDLLPDEVVEMKIHSAAHGIVLKLLSGVYSSMEVAALREYTANAWDSHRRAGQTRPVEVTLPTYEKPFLVIQDWGVGMDTQDLRLFSQYGYSDKRDDDDEIGGFGLGSKVGLGLGTQFSINAVKDGYRTLATCGWGDNGAPAMLLQEPIETSAENGVTITVPTSPHSAYRKAVFEEDIFLGWAPGTVKIDGEFPPTSVYDTDRFSELGTAGWSIKDPVKDTKRFSSEEYGRAVVGPVEYRFEYGKVGQTNYQLRRNFLKEVVIRLDNGSVDLTPSREQLKYTSKTVNALHDAVAAAMEEGKKAYLELVDQAPTIRDALLARQQANNIGFDGDYTYKGQQIQFSGVYEGMENSVTSARLNRVSGGGYKSSSVEHKMDTFATYRLTNLLRYPHILIVNAGVPVPVRRYTMHALAGKVAYLAKAMAEAEGKDPDTYRFDMTELPTSKINKFIVGTYDRVIEADVAEALATDYRKTQMGLARAANAGLSRAAREQVRLVTPHNGGNSQYRQQPLGELDPDLNYIVLPAGGSSSDNMAIRMRDFLMTRAGYGRTNHNLATVFQKLVDRGNYQFLLTTSTMKTKDYPLVLDNIATVREALETEFANEYKGLTNLEKRAALDSKTSKYNWVRQFAKEEDLDKINRKGTRDWIKALNGVPAQQAKMEWLNVLKAVADAFELEFKAKAVSMDLTTTLASSGDRYKMAPNYYYGKVEDLIEYINVWDSYLDSKGTLPVF